MHKQPLFRDREDAGRALARLVVRSVADPESLVLALPRGGVPIGYEVARTLQVELDIFLVRKLGLPGQEELAIGAIATGGVRILNRALIEEARLSEELVDRITAREERELHRREQVYRQGRQPSAVRGRTIILVDDGLATGATMKACSRAIRLQLPKRIVIAVPVAAQQTCDEFRNEVEEIICAHTPEPFRGVGRWYEDFSQTTDDEVRRLLAQAEGELSHQQASRKSTREN